MARGQGTAGDRGAQAALRPAEPGAPRELGRNEAAESGGDATRPGRARLTVAIHDRLQGEAVLARAAALGLEVELATAPGLATFAGVGFCVALAHRLGRPLLIDCGEEPGTALAALRAGARRVLVQGVPGVEGALSDIARRLGAELSTRPPSPLLVLAPGEDPAADLFGTLDHGCARGPSSPSGERL
jgi:hypothetical protein